MCPGRSWACHGEQSTNFAFELLAIKARVRQIDRQQVPKWREHLSHFCGLVLKAFIQVYALFFFLIQWNFQSPNLIVYQSVFHSYNLTFLPFCCLLTPHSHAVLCRPWLLISRLILTLQHFCCHRVSVSKIIHSFIHSFIHSPFNCCFRDPISSGKKKQIRLLSFS